MIDIPDGTACGHRACLSHKTYPCPFCGRIAGRALTTSERIAVELEKYLATDTQCLSNEDFFAQMVEVIDPILDFRSVRHISFAQSDTSLINTEEEAKRLCEVAIADDLGTDMSGFSSSAAKRSVPITLKIEPHIEPRHWLCIPARKNYLKAAWECIKFPFRLVANFLTAMGQVK